MQDSTYEFLDYELGPTSLTRRGKTVPVRPKTLATLYYLVSQSGRVVTKVELLDAVWPDVYVHDQAVFQSISELRSMLAVPECIETVRGRGYRWTLPLGIERAAPTPRRPFRRLAIPATFIAALAALTVWIDADAPRATTIVVHAGIASNHSGEAADTAPGVTQMLVQQLRQMGWDARRGGTEPAPADAVQVTIDLDTTDPALALRYTLSQGISERTGVVESATPLGAVRDLASALHQSLAVPGGPYAGTLEVADLVATAKRHIDAEDYELAKAYLEVVVAEQPEHLDARLAFAYAHQQTGHLREALDLSSAVHEATLDTGRRTERMMSAIIVSQVLGALADYEGSERFAREALEIGSELNDLLIIAEAQEQLGELSLAHGHVGIGKQRLIVALQYYSTFCPTGEARVSQRLLDLEHAALMRGDTREPTAGGKEIG